MSIKLKIGFIFLLGVCIILSIGYLSYNSLTSIVKSIQAEEPSDETLMTIRKIVGDFEKTEKNIRVYTIIGDEKYLSSFYHNISEIKKKIDQLKKKHSDNSLYSPGIDTLDYLIKEKIYVWNEIIKLYRQNNIEDKLEALTTKTDSINYIDSTNQEKRRLIKRLFTKKKKIEDVENENKELFSKIESIKLSSDSANIEMGKKEIQLSNTNSFITREIYDLIEAIEKNEDLKTLQKAKEAEQLSKETFTWIISFSVFGTILALLGLFILTRYLQKMKQYNIALVESKKAADDHVKAKESFLANISHELRTPLNAIQGYTEQMMSSESKNNEHLKIVKFSSDHLLQLINDLLNYSKLEAGKLKLSPSHYNLHSLLNDIISMLSLYAKKHDVNLKLFKEQGLPEIVFGDAFQLKQIIINLVSNAIRFSSKGNVLLNVSVGNLSLKKFNLIVKVEDDGIGIDESKLESIFENFTQEDLNVAKKYGGTGLGLSIVKKLVELHKGEIKVESKKHEGSLFTCTMPYLTGDPNNVEIKTDRLHQLDLNNHKVLIADDHPYNRDLLKIILKKCGANVVEAKNGQEVINILRDESFSFILLDMRMPVIDGFKIVKHIRLELNKSAKDLPIIIVSAINISETEKLFDNHEINGVLPKPVSEESLFNILSKNNLLKNKTINLIQSENQKFKNKTLDLSELKKLAGNDQNFIYSMLKNLIEISDIEFEKLIKAKNNMALPEISEITHKLASPFRHIGAEVLLNSLKDIESKSKQNIGINLLDGYIDRAFREYSKIKLEIDSFLHQSIPS